MPPNALYQTLVEALESQLAPRVVSRVLREGMAPGGATPDTLTMETVEAVLRGPVFRQLQTTGRDVSAARELVRELETYVRGTVEDETQVGGAAGSTGRDATDPTGASGAPTLTPASRATDGPAHVALSELQTALRPLNLYFSWPEVRKLRSLVQVAEDEFARGVDASVVVTEAEAQLQLVHQKLEDQLVLQARTLADLESVFEVVAPLGTPGVRRLDALIATVRDAQARRTLVEAETERAEKLARELRKLVESTILDEHDPLPDLGRGDGRPRAPTLVPIAGRDPLPGVPAADDHDAATAAAGAPVDLSAVEASAAADARDRLHALDLEGEARDLDTLAARHAELVRHEPALAAALDELRAEHRAGRVLGDRLARLERDWATQCEARRQALRIEFEAVRAETEALPPGVDAVDLRHALIVALDLLEQTLPAVEDIATVRELHATALAQSERLERERRERSERWQEQRAQIAAVRDRLEAAWRDAQGEPRLRRARERLQEALSTLHENAVTEEHGAILLESALDAEAAWQRSVAEASDDQTARRLALVRAMSARIAQLPDIPGLRARTMAVRAEVEALDADGVNDDARLHALTHLVEQLSGDARAAVAKRLDEIAREAGEPAPEALLRALQAAARQFDEGGFPDLDEVEREVALTHDVRRATLRRRYLRARQEAQRLADAGVPSAVGLMDLVSAAREAVDADVGAADAIDDLERRTAEVEREVAERLAGFEARLDAALSAFQTVARLNNDDVAAVRRVLMHLDDQRDAVGRVSPGLQAQLFASLIEAEGTLRHLEAAFEATRAVADQLVSGGRLDDLLGAFDSLFDAPAPEPQRARATGTPAQAPEVVAWLDRYLGADDVAGAVLLSPAGRLLAGRVPADVDVTAVGASIGATLEAWGALGERMGDEAPDLAQIEIGGRPTWLAPLEDQGCALVWSRRATPSTGLGTRLRDDRRELLGMLRGPGERSLPASGPDAATHEG
jgi:chromosome segregation protein